MTLAKTRRVEEGGRAMEAYHAALPGFALDLRAFFSAMDEFEA
ncbi:MAG: hypothetical protein ACLPYS_13510 [Vulcanimicrobiaceae bacterium]